MSASTRVRAHRESVGVSQPRLAELADVGFRTVCRVESGARVSRRTRARIADALVLPEPQLFADDGTPLTVIDS